jgi:hypothetical protein
MMSRRLFHFLPLPKFKDGLTMPFTKAQPEDVADLRDLAFGWGKVVSRRAYGTEGPGLDCDFDSIESLAVEVGQAVIRGTIEEALRTQLKLLGDHQPCPTCRCDCRVETVPRTIQIRGGTIRYDEPRCHCPACRRDFFPSAAQLAARLAQLLPGDPR